MKKIIALLPLLLLTTMFLNAQTTDKKVRKAVKFEKGDVELKVGYGLVSLLFEKGSESLVAPVSASLLFRLNERFSLGAYAGYTSNRSTVKEQLNGTAYQYENNFLMLGMKAQAHIISVENFDLYGGMIMTYNKPFVEVTEFKHPLSHGDDNPSDLNPTPHKPGGPDSSLLFGGYVGGAYYVTKNLNVFAEVGYGVSLGTVGLGYKF